MMGCTKAAAAKYIFPQASNVSTLITHTHTHTLTHTHTHSLTHTHTHTHTHTLTHTHTHPHLNQFVSHLEVERGVAVGGKFHIL